MAGNTFGQIFKLTTFGESHGPGIGGVIDGCPSKLPLCEADIQGELDKRRPGQGLASTARKEPDQVKILSGVFEGQTTGTPIAFYIANQDQRSRDYSKIKDIFRPGHGDFTYQAKYGLRDYRGGGRSSGRETAARVAGGAIAHKVIQAHGISVWAYTKELGGISARTKGLRTEDLQKSQDNPFFAPNLKVVPQWEERIKEVKKAGESIGGLVEIQALGVPAGLGEPVFDKLDARLAYALMGVGAVKAVEIGAGLEAARLLGSQNNDPLDKTGFSQNNAGGILAGISSGQAIITRATIKPIPSIALVQQTINMAGEKVTLRIEGRHDVSAIPRIVPVLKAMVCLVLADMLLLQQARQ